MTESYKHLIKRLNRFREKYYLFKLFQGVITFISVIVIYFSAVIIGETVIYLSPAFKIILLIVAILILISLFIWNILLVLLKLTGIRKQLTKKQTAKLLRNFLPELDDTIINAIELAEDYSESSNKDLIFASIDQKIEKLKVFNFTSAIKFTDLKYKFLRVLLIIATALSVFIVFKADVSDAVIRLVHYQKEFIKPAPFSFQLLNEKLSIRKSDNLEIKLKITGKKIPDLVYLSFGGNRLLMKKNQDVFTYEIENINNSFPFYFYADEYVSDKYLINVLQVPIIEDFEIKILPPLYTNQNISTLKNVGDLKVIRGTNVEWKFKTAETDSLKIYLDSKDTLIALKDDNYFITKYKLYKSGEYSISIKNENFKENDLLKYKIEITDDLYPEIDVVQVKDSINFYRFYFKGKITDDYGFKQLQFNIKNEVLDSIIEIPIIKNLKEQEFYFSYDFNGFREKYKEINYYFSVFDNDEVSRYKENTSEYYQIIFPDLKNVLDIEKEEFSKIEDLIKESYELNNEIQNEIQNLKTDEVNSVLSDWEKQQKIEDINSKREKLEDILDDIQKKNKDLNNFTNSQNEQKKEILDKQKQIEELLNEVMSDELKELFKEFNELAKQFDPKKFDDLSDKMDMRLDDLSKQLERNLQILKRMKVIQKTQYLIDELYKISESEKGIQNILEEENDASNIIGKEKQNNEKVGALIEEYSSIMELNQLLTKPLNLADFSMEFDEILKNYKSIEEFLENKKLKKAEENINKNIGDIENLAFSIQSMLDANTKKEAGEDLENLKQILDNLISLSFEQEEIMDKTKLITNGDPLINKIRFDQKKLMDKNAIVRDSLYMLALRNEQITNVISTELINIEINNSDIEENLEQNAFYNVIRFQQNIVTAYNNLSLYMSEILEKIEEQMANAMPGDQECDKPGGKKSGMSMLKQGQEALKNQLQKMIDQMKNGSNEGISKQLGKTLSQNEIMQKLVRDLMNDGSVGSDAKEQLKMVDQLLEGTKNDIINRNITQQTINRQNMILNKLLEAEISENEREIDKERESKTAVEEFYSNPNKFFQYNEEDDLFEERFQKGSNTMEKFYDLKYKEYLKRLNSGKIPNHTIRD